jgi:hypothetical protein
MGALLARKKNFECKSLAYLIPFIIAGMYILYILPILSYYR